MNIVKVIVRDLSHASDGTKGDLISFVEKLLLLSDNKQYEMSVVIPLQFQFNPFLFNIQVHEWDAYY
jgi:hypothetical protein